MFPVQQASSDEEFKKILQLRYEILRRPWNQPIESATDALEQHCVNAYIEQEGKVIAAGRLQENENKTGQIRFMAVDSAWQGKGLGKDILLFLEGRAREMGLLKIELQARENAVRFYESKGYVIKETSFLLWGQIQHYLMKKEM